MESASKQKYDDLRRRLEVDLLRLDDELIELPMLTMEASEQAAVAQSIRDAMRSERQALQAQISREVEQTHEKKPAEAALERAVLLDERYRRADDAVMDAELDYSLWKGLVDSLRTKSTSLKTACELILAGYLTPNSIIKDRHREAQNKKSK